MANDDPEYTEKVLRELSYDPLYKIWDCLMTLEKNEEKYLKQIRKSHPHLLEEVRELFCQCRQLYYSAMEVKRQCAISKT